MNEFATPFVRTTKLGYCLSSLEVALNHILNFTKQDLVLDDDEQNRFNSNWGDARRSMSRSIRQSIY